MKESAENRERLEGATDRQSVAPLPRLLDLKGAGKYLGLSYWTVRELVFAGTLPTVKLPCPRAKDGRVLRRILIDVRDLDAIIEANKDAEHF